MYYHHTIHQFLHCVTIYWLLSAVAAAAAAAINRDQTDIQCSDCEIANRYRHHFHAAAADLHFRCCDFFADFSRIVCTLLFLGCSVRLSVAAQWFTINSAAGTQWGAFVRNVCTRGQFIWQPNNNHRLHTHTRLEWWVVYRAGAECVRNCIYKS